LVKRKRVRGVAMGMSMFSPSPKKLLVWGKAPKKKVFGLKPFSLRKASKKTGSAFKTVRFKVEKRFGFGSFKRKKSIYD